MNITDIKALEILDSRGNPTVQATVYSDNLSATASVPSGASTGIHEALELRDGDKTRFGGKGVLKACSNIEGPILDAVKGLNAEDQEKLDETLLKLDGTPNKANLGANAILAVSLACARLAAKGAKMELFSYLAQRYGYTPKSLPTPLFNVINGGKHADSGLDIQEFFLIPQRGIFNENLRMGAEVFHALKNQLATQGLTTAVGDEGGFAPKLGSNEKALTELSSAISAAGYKPGLDFRLGMDAAASEFFNQDQQVYDVTASGKKFKPEEIYTLYKEWNEKFHLQIIEDGCAEDDILGWQKLTEALGGEVLLVGDDLFVTNPERIKMGIEKKIANAVLIKVNQIGTLTETLQAVKLGQKNGYKIIISHRSGETADSFIADLAVATGAEFIKTGAPSRGERVAKYNRLLEIEKLLEA